MSNLPDRPWRTAGYGLGLMMDIASPHGLCIGHSGQGPDSVAAAYHFPDLDHAADGRGVRADRRPGDRRAGGARRGGAAALNAHCAGAPRLSKQAALARLRGNNSAGRDVANELASAVVAGLVDVCAPPSAALPGAALAEYPDNPIHLIVPQAAGSATDTVARILASELGPQFGQTVIVEDRPGGALTIGIDNARNRRRTATRSAVGPIGALAITRHMVAKLPYNIEKDLQPIALIARGHLMLAVSAKSDIDSVKDLIAYAKANPGKLTNASSSNGSPGHVGGELFKFMTGTQIVHVPYRGGSAAINDLIAGRVDLMFESLNSICRCQGRPGARPRRQRAARSVAFPDIPTVAEAGVPGYKPRPGAASSVRPACRARR